MVFQEDIISLQSYRKVREKVCVTKEQNVIKAAYDVTCTWTVVAIMVVIIWYLDL